MAAVDINVFEKPLTIGRGIPKHFRGFLEALQMCGKQVVCERLSALPIGQSHLRFLPSANAYERIFCAPS